MHYTRIAELHFSLSAYARGLINKTCSFSILIARFSVLALWCGFYCGCASFGLCGFRRFLCCRCGLGFLRSLMAISFFCGSHGLNRHADFKPVHYALAAYDKLYQLHTWPLPFSQSLRRSPTSLTALHFLSIPFA